MPMGQQDDVLAARNALRALQRAAVAVAAHYGDSVDAKRLLMDLERVSTDLDLLCGNESVAAAAPRLQVIEDTAYPQDFWMDAEDEGLGGGR
jgi:hypothetical protein